LSDIVPLNQEEQVALARSVRVRHLDKGEVWIKEGSLASHLAFVSEGSLRVYYTRTGGEVTDGFYFENSFAGDLPGAITRRASLVNIAAMESTELFTLAYVALNDLAARHHALERLLRVLTERVFVNFYYRRMATMASPPQERFTQLQRDQPQALHRAAPGHVASFLGITEPSLSRLSGRLH
jgi:CRP-like cAMP-binding protein